MPIYELEFIEVRKVRAYSVADSKEKAIELIKQLGSHHPGAENIELPKVMFIEVVEEHKPKMKGR